MKNIYCTLFDHKYLSRGLALFESLQKLDDNIELYVVAMDNAAYAKLVSEKIKNMVVISIADIEQQNPRMLVAKGNRSAMEYCWTCTPCIIYHILTHYECDVCTYLDSDIYFYKNPNDLFNKLKDYSTMLVPHLFSKRECHVAKRCGKYCVEFVPFKKEKRSMEILEHWTNQCLEWCYDLNEDDRFGDQKYLEEWEKWDDVYISQDHGLGVAPWNAERFDLIKNEDGSYELIDLENDMQKYPLIFYHYSRFKLYDKDVVGLDAGTGRVIPDKIREELYVGYLKAIEEVNVKYQLTGGNIDYNGIEHFRSDDLDHLMNDRGYFRKSILLTERGKEI